MKKPVRERRQGVRARRIQYAALPYRQNGKLGLEVMLVTTRDTGRWIIPKGWPKHGKLPPDTAAEEAFEEAGVAGKIGNRPIGTYSYDKIMRKGDSARCSVWVFALRVTRQHKRWPEKRERKVRWYKANDAAKYVREPYLRRIIRNFARRY